MSDARIVLFGGSGFVGSNLCKYLNADMIVPKENEADLTRLDSLRQVINPGDIVINAAGYANATDTTEKGKAIFQAVNVDGMRNLAEASRDKGAAQLIHISSVAAMGKWHREGVTEEMLKPVNSPYAASKRAGEEVLFEYMDTIPITILRPTSVFGEGRGLARTLFRLVSKGTVPIPGSGSALIPFTYIGNIARCVELAIGNDNCYGRTFIVGDENSYSLSDILFEIGNALGVKVKLVKIPVGLCQVCVRFFEAAAMLHNRSPLFDSGRLDTLTTSVSYSISMFRSATQYQQPFTFQESVRRIAVWYMDEINK